MEVEIQSQGAVADINCSSITNDVFARIIGVDFQYDVTQSDFHLGNSAADAATYLIGDCPSMYVIFSVLLI